ncbi:MAG: hypothetical protein R6X32_12505 [Chloroflexota bacterium]|jgi:hypothetical protein
MKQVAIYQQGAIVSAGVLPLIGAFLQSEWVLLLLFGMWPVVWLLLMWGEGKEKTAVYIPADYPNYLLVLIVLLLAYGAWLDVAVGWLLGSMLAALAAWDLEAFQKRLRRATHIEQEAQIVQHHLRRLLAALTLSLLLGTAALLLQFELRFGWGLLLILFVVLSFNQVLRGLRQ